MGEDLRDHRPREDGRDDLQLPAAAVRAGVHVDVEHPLEQPCPADAVRPAVNRLGLAFVGSCDFGGLLLHLRSLRHHQWPKLRVRGQNAVEPDEVQPRPRHQCRQPLHELQRAHDQMRGAVAPRRLELELHLPGGVELHPFVGERRPRDVAAQLLQPLAVVGLHPHRRVQAEPVDVGAQRLARPVLARHRAPERQHLLPGAGAEGDAIGDGRGLQRPQRARLVTVGIGLGQVSLARVLDQHAPAREHLHQPGDDGLQQRVQLVVGRRIHLDEHRLAIVAALVHAAQNQTVQVDVEIGDRAEALDQPVVAALAAAQPQKAVGQDAALEEDVELVLDESRQLRSGAGLGVAMKLAACCCTRRYSVVCSGRCRS